MPSRSTALRSAAGLLALSLALGACGRAEEPADPSPSQETAASSAPAHEATPSPSRPSSRTPEASTPTPSATPTPAPSTSTPTAAPTTRATPSSPAPDSPSAAPTTSHTPSPVFPDEPVPSASVRPAPTRTTSPAKPTAPAAPSTTPAPQSSAPATRPPATAVDCAAVRCIALTFDDGPAPATGRLLDILAAEGVPATFYVVGQSAARNPALVSRMAEEGHQVGGHSWSHPLFTQISPAEVGEELDRTDAAIRAAGVVPSTVRAPYGALNPSVLAALGRRGEGSVTWTVDTRDWEHLDPAQTLANVRAQARPGAIVLMHDLHPTSVDAVPSVIAWLRAQGYVFVTVDQITGGVAPGTTVARGLHP